MDVVFPLRWKTFKEQNCYPKLCLKNICISLVDWLCSICAGHVNILGLIRALLLQLHILMFYRNRIGNG